MRALATKNICILLLTLPLFGQAQTGSEKMDGEGNAPEVVGFTSIPANGTLYFKATIERLEHDMQLILEKKVSGKEEPIVVDTQKGIGTDKEIPLLYSFKDPSPNDQATLYRLRGIRFLENGETRLFLLAEKRFTKGLLSLKKEE